MMKALYIFILFTCTVSAQYPDLLMASIQQNAGYDVDAQAYFDAATGLSVGEMDAWNNFVLSAKANGYYSKLVAAYPLRGSSSTDAKWNAIDPRDLDAAFRVTFSGTNTFDSDGYTSDGTTGYGDTHWIANANGTYGNFSWGFYYQDNISGGQTQGVLDGGGRNITIYPRYSDDKAYSALGSTSTNPNATSLNSQGFWVTSQTSTTSHKFFHNGSQIGSTDTVDYSSNWALIDYSMFVGAGNSIGSAYRYMTGTISFYFIGDGLTDGEVSDIYTDIEAFMDELGIGVN